MVNFELCCNFDLCAFLRSLQFWALSNFELCVNLSFVYYRKPVVWIISTLHDFLRIIIANFLGATLFEIPLANVTSKVLSRNWGFVRIWVTHHSSKSILRSLLGPIWILRDMVHRSLYAQKASSSLCLSIIESSSRTQNDHAQVLYTPPLGCITSWITLNPFISSSLIHLMPYVKCRDLGECFRFVVLSPNASFTYSPISHLEMFLFIFEFIGKNRNLSESKTPS